MRVMSFNIRRAFGEDGATSVRRIANVIRAQQPDLAGLNEVWRLPMLHDQPSALARALDMTPVFQENVGSRGLQRFGNLVLARPALHGHLDLKLPGGLQRRGMLLVEVADGDRMFHFGSTHLALGRKARRMQIEAIAAGLPHDEPVVLVGDFNSTDDSDFEPLLEVLEMAPTLPTYSSLRPTKPLDRIFFSHHFELESRFTVASRASDHLPLVADLRWRERL